MHCAHTFPVGKSDTLEETAVQTARREAFEEIGLPDDDRQLPSPLQVEHLCELPSSLALTELGVRPCVALLHTGDDPRDPEQNLIPRLEPKEVAAVFTAPLRKFLSDRDERGRDERSGSKWYSGFWGPWHQERVRMHQFNVPKKSDDSHSSDESYRVFGMTARILLDTARLAYAEDPSFEHVDRVGDEPLLKKLLASGRFSGERSSGSRMSLDDIAKVAKL